jgi:hypothetical protein
MIVEETISEEELAAEATQEAAPEPIKRTRKPKGEAAPKAPKEPKPPKAPKEPRVKIEWKPTDGPYPVNRGQMLTAKINVLHSEHGFTGKKGKFLDAILASETAMEALGVPAVTTKAGEEITEFMDPGYITFAVRSGLIALEQPAAAAE